MTKDNIDQYADHAIDIIKKADAFADLITDENNPANDNPSNKLIAMAIYTCISAIMKSHEKQFGFTLEMFMDHLNACEDDNDSESEPEWPDEINIPESKTPQRV